MDVYRSHSAGYDHLYSLRQLGSTEASAAGWRLCGLFVPEMRKLSRKLCNAEDDREWACGPKAGAASRRERTHLSKANRPLVLHYCGNRGAGIELSWPGLA
jgi:hypothetical protein